MAFVEASRSQAEPPTPTITPDMPIKAQKRVLREEEAQLRAQRRRVRQKRRKEDETWKVMRQMYGKMASAPPSVTGGDTTWVKAAQRGLRQHRKRLCAQRQTEDRLWRQQRHALRSRWAELPTVTAWIAILVITDNCSRHCPGLPLFVAGSHVTADAIVAALKDLLPPTLRFLSTESGNSFSREGLSRSCSTSRVYPCDDCSPSAAIERDRGTICSNIERVAVRGILER